MQEPFDLIIAGGGPAGYVAAEKAAALGFKVMLAERDRLGGACLNRGCIPTKTLLHSAKLYRHAREAGVFGVHAEHAAFSFSEAKARMAKVRDTLRQGVAGLMKKSGVTVVEGNIRLAGRTEAGFRVAAGEGEGAAAYAGRRLLLCVGSRVSLPPIPGLAGNPHVQTSDDMLAAQTSPTSLVIIGGGVIGMEFAALHAMAGVPTTVIEMLPAIGGPGLDREAAKTLQRQMEETGAQFFLSAKVERIDGPTVHFTDSSGAPKEVSADVILAATGRIPSTDGLGAETLGLELVKGAIPVDHHGQTGVPGVYAAGDCTGRIQLAHYASRQAVVAVSHMSGKPQRMREEAIPSVLYTDPEIATVGLTEARAKERGIAVQVSKLPMAASGRYVAENEGGRAYVKAILSQPAGYVLGMTVVGPYASEMIAAACLMVELELRASDVAEMVFPHPTVAELMRDVMM